MWNDFRSLLTALRPAFSRKATYCWFVVVFVGFIVRYDTLGVTSIVRALGSMAPISRCFAANSPFCGDLAHLAQCTSFASCPCL